MNPKTVKSPPSQNPKPNYEAEQIPDSDYSIVPTACQYCVVGCGYEAHIWKGEGSDLSPQLEQGLWVSPSMTEQVTFDDQIFTAAVIPDPKCPMNKGNHSSRGGTMGRDLVSVKEDGSQKELASVKERFTQPMVRTANGWEVLTADESQALIAQLIMTATEAEQHPGQADTLHFKYPQRLGVKLFEYGSLENTYAATKLFFKMIGTPNVAFHDRPSLASNTQGFNDSGINPHGYAYADIWDSDILFLAGSNPYENQSVFFMQQMTGKRIIVLDPRRTITADYAEKTGGLHLQPTVLGSDVAVINALCRYVIEKRGEKGSAQWYEWGGERLRGIAEFIRTAYDKSTIQKTVDRSQAEWLDGADRLRQARNQMNYAEFETFILEQPSLSEAASISGIELEKLKQAAHLLSGPLPESNLPDTELMSRYLNPNTRKVSVIFEKGLIWGYNYHNTAAIANLGLVLGSVLRHREENGNDDPLDNSNADPAPLGVTGRAGGHQKGWARCQYITIDKEGKPHKQHYPFYNSKDFFNDGTWLFPTHHYFDAHLVGTAYAQRHPWSGSQAEEGQSPDVNLLWVVGANPAGQIAEASAKWQHIKIRRGDDVPASKQDALEKLKLRISNNGLVIIHQDIYPNLTSQYADIILPAKGWGEHEFTRYTGERRLRLYGRFQDAPSLQCLEDWRWFAGVGKAMLNAANKEFAHGLPLGMQMHEPVSLGQFSWDNSEAIFSELASYHEFDKKTYANSNRSKLFSPLLNTEEVLDSEQQHAPYEYLRKRGTLGILVPAPENLPAVDDYTQEGSHRVLPKPFANSDSVFNYAFVKNNWFDIQPYFERNKPGNDEYYICNGRINELWNSLFTHIRNETVINRYPDDMQGTIIEIGEADATELDVNSGDVVEIAKQNHSFKAVVIVQQDIQYAVLPRRMAFVYFSYPVNTKNVGMELALDMRSFAHDGYVNNVSSNYVDPQNPIAAIKYSRGKIIKTGFRYSGLDLPRHIQRPSTEHRHTAFYNPPINDERERLKWKMRELIIKIGLPRASYGPHPHYQLDSPDRFISEMEIGPSGETFDAFYNNSPSNDPAAMKWMQRWPRNTRNLLDEWSPAERRLVANYLSLFEDNE